MGTDYTDKHLEDKYTRLQPEVTSFVLCLLDKFQIQMFI